MDKIIEYLLGHAKCLKSYMEMTDNCRGCKNVRIICEFDSFSEHGKCI